MKIRLLSNDDVAGCLSMSRAIELMEKAFSDLSRNSVVSPVRTAISNANGTMLYKPSLLESANRSGIKIVSVFQGNADRGLPVTTGLMLVNDAGTGLPLAILNAERLTALRTGAAAGLATRMLANPETTTAALFGTGGQAPDQIAAMQTVLPLKKIHVFSRKFERAIDFCNRYSSVSDDCQLVPARNRGVLVDCGVITTATTSEVPVFDDRDILAGTHINGIGSFKPSMCEIPLETVARSVVFVDHRIAAIGEAGEIVQAIRSGRVPENFAPAELGEVVLGKMPGRKTSREITFFKSVGNAAQDIVCAAEIMEVAAQLKLGQLVELG